MPPAWSQIDAGFGIDCLRLEALATETVSALQHVGQIEVTARAMAGAMQWAPTAPW